MASSTITGTQQGLVLVGSGTGLSVFPSPTALTRLNYFDGKFLRAADLKLEQQYLRQLVALSNQAGCAGVVHGFSARLGEGDSMELTAGLAIDAEGQVLMMPRPTTANLSELLALSSRMPADRAAAVSPPPAPGTTGDAQSAKGAVFADCELRAVEVPGQVLEATNLHLIVICHAEAFCGEEDVYGKLCEEACVTSTDRPYLVEGVAIRALPLELDTPLKTSSAVALNGKHLRSRVASAYFADRWGQIPSLVSRAGLESRVWCDGAAPDVGTCVPIGLLARAGSQTLFLDAWTARRERMDTPPRKYWDARLVRRPWSEFLAQLLQFQCQLHQCIGGVGDPGAQDPCAEAVEVLRRTSSILAGMLEERPDTPGGGLPSTEVPGIPSTPVQGVNLNALQNVQIELASAARRLFLTPRDRLLINCGIVETPAGGYLPVVPTGEVTVNQQVRRWFGEGVDLRFCVVRPDFVAHALEEVQHMDRICLLKGLDDPDSLEEVDVLIPEGEFVRRGLDAGTAFRAVVGMDLGERSPTRVEGTARGVRLSTGGVEFHTAGAETVARIPPVSQPTDSEIPGPVGTAGSPDSHVTGFETRPPTGAQPGFETTLETLAAEARIFSAAQRARRVAVNHGRLPAGASRVFTQSLLDTRVTAGWLTLYIEVDPFEMSVGATAHASARMVLYRPGEVLYDRQFTDVEFTLDEMRPIGARRSVLGRLRIIGVSRTWRPQDGWEIDDVEEDVMLQVDRERLPNGTEVLQASFPLEPDAPHFSLTGGGSPVTLRAELNRPPHGDEDGPQRVAEGSFQESSDVLEPSNSLHQKASQALDLIEAGLQESGFADLGREALYPRPPASEELDVLAKRDWVFFHRRRTKDCAIEDRPERPPPQPVRVTCQEVWHLVNSAEIFNGVLQSISSGTGDLDATTILRQRGAVKLGEVEFVQGTDQVFMNSLDPIVAAWGRRTLQRLALIAESRDPGKPSEDPRIMLYRDQASTIARALPQQAAGLVAQGVDTDKLVSNCPAITLLGTDAPVETVCNAVYAWPDPVVTTFPGSFMNGVKVNGFTGEHLTMFENNLLGLATFKKDTEILLENSLEPIVDKWKERLSQLEDVPGTISPAVIGFSRMNTPDGPHEQHVAQSDRVRQEIGGTRPAEGVIVPTGEFPTDCPAVTLVIPVPVGDG